MCVCVISNSLEVRNDLPFVYINIFARKQESARRMYNCTIKGKAAAALCVNTQRKKYKIKVHPYVRWRRRCAEQIPHEKNIKHVLYYARWHGGIIELECHMYAKQI